MQNFHFYHLSTIFQQIVITKNIQVEADNKLELGLTVLDEPSAKQSDPNIIELQLRSVSKTSNSRMSKIKKVSDVDKEVKIVEKWIKDIEDLHRSKPAPTIQYSKQMPDIDHLMQVIITERINFQFQNFCSKIHVVRSGLMKWR